MPKPVIAEIGPTCGIGMICKFVRSTLRNCRCYTQRERRSYTRILGPNTPDKSQRGSSLGSEKRWLRRLGRPPPRLRRRPRFHIPAPVLVHSRDVDIEIAPGRDQRSYDLCVVGLRRKRPAMRRVRTELIRVTAMAKPPKQKFLHLNLQGQIKTWQMQQSCNRFGKYSFYGGATTTGHRGCQVGTPRRNK